MSAHISECGRYRYALKRDMPPPLDPGRGYSMTVCTFVMLNPSTADAKQDDPTIRRCMRFARDWGYTRLKVVNLYAYRATRPDDLWTADDPVGPENDHALSLAFGGSDLTIAAWGVNAKPDRVQAFNALFEGWPLWCLGLTADGSPRHPLYVRADRRPVPYNASARASSPAPGSGVSRG